MANSKIANGYIVSSDMQAHQAVLAKIDGLSPVPTQHGFSIWKGVFHAPSEPHEAGYIVTFGLSGHGIEDVSQIGQFLDFWENFVHDLAAEKLFLVVELTSSRSNDPFGKFYFEWQNHGRNSAMASRWVFCGALPLDVTWKSRFVNDTNEISDLPCNRYEITADVLCHDIRLNASISTIVVTENVLEQKDAEHFLYDEADKQYGKQGAYWFEFSNIRISKIS